MDDSKAKELLAAERKQVEEELAAMRREGPEEEDARREPGDNLDEGLYQDEFDAGREQDLRRRLEAIERAEKRPEEGTYGRSVRSGEPIPDERLEANPTAELTVSEAHGGRG